MATRWPRRTCLGKRRSGRPADRRPRGDPGTGRAPEATATPEPAATPEATATSEPTAPPEVDAEVDADAATGTRPLDLTAPLEHDAVDDPAPRPFPAAPAPTAPSRTATDARAGLVEVLPEELVADLRVEAVTSVTPGGAAGPGRGDGTPRTHPILGFHPGDPAATSGDDAIRYLNRELSWLQFDERVLALAEDPDLPLLERAKFLAIFATNLDEFFQVRVAGLKEQLAAGVTGSGADGMGPAEQLAAIDVVVTHADRPPRRGVPATRSAPGLAERGIRLSRLGRARRRRPAPGSTRCSTNASSRCSPRWPSTRPTRSRTSPTCR